MTSQSDPTKEGVKSIGIEKEVERLSPLSLSKPEEITEGIKSTESNQSSKSYKEILPSIRDYVGSYISLADAKAGVLVGIYTLLLSYDAVRGMSFLKKSIGNWNSIDCMAVATWILLTGAIACALYVVWPRTKSNNRRGLVSWVHISVYDSSEEYVKEFLAADDSLLFGNLCELNYDLAKICKRKYIWLSRAFKIGIVGVFIMVLTLIRSSS